MSHLLARRSQGRSTLGPRGRTMAFGATGSTLGPRGRTLGNYSFGDAGATMTEEEWRTKMLEQQTSVTDWLSRWVKRDELQRWLQLGATLAIPLSAAIWKAIFRATRRDD